MTSLRKKGQSGGCFTRPAEIRGDVEPGGRPAGYLVSGTFKGASQRSRAPALTEEPMVYVHGMASVSSFWLPDEAKIETEQE